MVNIHSRFSLKVACGFSVVFMTDNIYEELLFLAKEAFFYFYFLKLSMDKVR